MDTFASDDNSREPGNRHHFLTVPDAVSHRALIVALAAEHRRDIPRERADLFPLLQDLLDRHWSVEPPTEEERNSVLELLSSTGH